MPMLNIYVSDETWAQLSYHASQDAHSRDIETLAEDCVADAAIRNLPNDWRETGSNQPQRDAGAANNRPATNNGD